MRALRRDAAPSPGRRLEQCPECGGSGRVQHVAQTAFGQFVQASACAACGGRGVRIDSPCHDCRGRGRLTVRRGVEVQVPPGIASGQRLRLAGRGHEGEGGAGDLYVQVAVAADPQVRARRQRPGHGARPAVHAGGARSDRRGRDARGLRGDRGEARHAAGRGASCCGAAGSRCSAAAAGATTGSWSACMIPRKLTDEQRAQLQRIRERRRRRDLRARRELPRPPARGLPVNRYRLRVPADDAEVALAADARALPGRRGGGARRSGCRPRGLRRSRRPRPTSSPSPSPHGWEDAWRAFHRPVRVGRLWIGPPWFEPEEIAVVIDPGPAFGTGAHGSTRAALELLGRLEPSAGARPRLRLRRPLGRRRPARVRASFGRSISTRWPSARRPRTPPETASTWRSPGPTSSPIRCRRRRSGWRTSSWACLRRLLERPDLPARILASGLTADQTLGGVDRVEVDGWAAEVLDP